MGKREFDYYIFIDYSESLVGYCIVEGRRVRELLPKISKIKHYNEVNQKKQYLKAIKRIFETHNIIECLFALKIKRVTQTLEIFADIAEFIKSYVSSSIFISLDDKQSSNFERLVRVVDGEKVLIVKESALRKDTPEHKLSLIIDNLLNLERVKGL